MAKPKLKGNVVGHGKKVKKPGAPKGSKPPIAKAPKKKAPEKPLEATDSTYARQLAQYRKLQSDFEAEQKRKAGETAQYYGTEATPEKKAAVTKKVTRTQKVANPFSAHNKKRYDELVKAGKHKQAAAYRRRATKAGTKRVTTEEPQYDVKKQLLGRKRHVQNVLLNPGGKGPKKYKQKVSYTNEYKTTKTPKYKVTPGVKATEGVYQRELRDTRTKDLGDIRNDYSARGLLRSGLYAQKNSDYEKEFGKQMAEISRKKASTYGQLGTEKRQFGREQEIQKEQARLEAARRRAAIKGTLNF